MAEQERPIPDSGGSEQEGFSQETRDLAASDKTLQQIFEERAREAETKAPNMEIPEKTNPKKMILEVLGREAEEAKENLLKMIDATIELAKERSTPADVAKMIKERGEIERMPAGEVLGLWEKEIKNLSEKRLGNIGAQIQKAKTEKQDKSPLRIDFLRKTADNARIEVEILYQESAETKHKLSNIQDKIAGISKLINRQGIMGKVGWLALRVVTLGFPFERRNYEVELDTLLDKKKELEAKLVEIERRDRIERSKAKNAYRELEEN